MSRERFISISHKLTLLMVMVSMVVVAVASALFYKSEKEILETSAIESARLQAGIISASLTSAIIFNDEFSASETLGLLSENEQVRAAAVFLPDSALFALYGDMAELPDIIPENDGFSIDTADTIKTSVDMGESCLHVSQWIFDQDIVIGKLYIRISLDDLNLQRQHYREILFYVLLFSIVLASLLSMCAQYLISQPINRMVEYVTGLSHSKDYTKRLHLTSHDELGTLAKGFDHLIDVVQEREQKLQDHSDNLQSIVNERTEQLYHKAHFDSLTLLPNRYLLSDRLEHAMASAKRNGEGLAILFMDLDRFKIINDSLGHDVGDELLKAAARRLQELGRDCDTIARLGGDEFIYLAEGISQPEDAGRIAEKIHQAFSLPFVLQKHELHVATSIGISIYPSDGTESVQLLKNADVSMYHAKEQGPGNYSFYRDDMNKAIHERLEIENQLRQAIAKHEFHLVYQPQVCLESNRVSKVEALIRWSNEELGVVSPAQFIPIAEEIGMINELGKWVINEVCRQQKQWIDKDVCVGINISSSQLLDVTLLSYLNQMSESHNTALNLLEFEITEEVFLKRSERTIKTLNEIQKLGIKIAIDDFGTGYSSLSYLKNLPVDTLKLDGMFVMDLGDNRASRGIVSSTIILAHSLNMKIVAECVEDETQLNFLKRQYCDYAQGFHLYKPMPAEELLKII